MLTVLRPVLMLQLYKIYCKQGFTRKSLCLYFNKNQENPCQWHKSYQTFCSTSSSISFVSELPSLYSLNFYTFLRQVYALVRKNPASLKNNLYNLKWLTEVQRTYIHDLVFQISKEIGVFPSEELNHIVVVTSGVTMAVKLAFKDRVMTLGTNALQEFHCLWRVFFGFFKHQENRHRYLQVIPKFKPNSGKIQGEWAMEIIWIKQR